MKLRKLIRLLIFFSFFIFFVWIGWHAYNAVNFKKYTYSSEKSPFELKGAYHLHTIYSDGIRTPEEIAERALRAGLDFIIITDHGNPNRKSLNHQGWMKGILVIAGSEVSVREGHFVALGFKIPENKISIIAKYAMRQIRKLGGFSIIAHPYNMRNPWTGWEAKDFLGIEIINMDSAWRRGFIFSIPYYLLFPLNPHYCLLKMIDFPDRNLEKWDELCFNKKVYGFFAVDAHLFYESLFKILNLHVLINKPLSSDFLEAKEMIFNALSRGRFYNAIEGVAQADGFRFWAERGERRFEMGDQIRVRLPVSLYVKAPFPYNIEIRLIHRGRTVLKTKKKKLNFRAKKYGAYRIEVYLLDPSPLSKKIPWIVSNPIFLRKIKGRRKIKNE